MTREIVFHIGLEKTGTTAFQRFCAAHRGALARRGVLYPRFRARRRTNHAAFAASYLADAVADPSIVAFAPTRERAVRALRCEMDRSSAAATLLSAEHLSSRFDDARAAALASDFADRDARVVVAVRDLHARFLSAYGTAVVSGGRLSLDAYADEVLDPANPYLDIAATLGPWRRAFGAGRVAVVDYDAAGGDVVPALLRACGVDGASLRGPAGRDKPTPSRNTVRVLRLCNGLLHDRQGRPSARPLAVWAQHRVFSVACRRALDRLSRGGEAPRGAEPWTVSRHTLDRLDRAAAAERRWLLDHHGVALRGSDARRHLTVGGGEPSSARDAALARDVVDRVAGPLWRVGEALVAASAALERLR